VYIWLQDGEKKRNHERQTGRLGLMNVETKTQASQKNPPPIDTGDLERKSDCKKAQCPTKKKTFAGKKLLEL